MVNTNNLLTQHGFALTNVDIIMLHINLNLKNNLIYEFVSKIVEIMILMLGLGMYKH